MTNKCKQCGKENLKPNVNELAKLQDMAYKVIDINHPEQIEYYCFKCYNSKIKVYGQ